MTGEDENILDSKAVPYEPVEAREAINLKVTQSESDDSNQTAAPQEVAETRQPISPDQSLLESQSKSQDTAVPKPDSKKGSESVGTDTDEPGIKPAPSLDSLSLPSIAVGILTAGPALVSLAVAMIWWFASYVSASYTLGMVVNAGYVFIAFSLMHAAWFYKSQRTLLKYTGQIIPATDLNIGWSASVRFLLPLAWLTLLCIYCTQFLFLSQYPIIYALPVILTISLIYWIVSMLSFPRRLKRLYDAETGGRSIIRQEAEETSIFSFLSSLAYDPGVVSFPKFAMTVLLAPFLTAPYIWYWKMSIIAIHRERKALKQKVKKSGDRLVIRYRKYAVVERWFRQRYAEGGWIKYSRTKKILVIAAVPLFCALVSGEAALLGKTLLPAIDFARGHATSAFQTSHASSTVAASDSALSLIGLIAAALLLLAFLKVRFQPSHYEFTKEGFRSFRFNGNKKVYGALTAWTSLNRVRLAGGDKDRQVSASAIQFQVSGGKDVKLPLDCIESIEDRESILQAIELWAPAVGRDASVMQVLQPPVDHNYTELWLQALAAPPQRDRLKPLIKDALVNQGRYKVVRALGVGGQGAAYEALDVYLGETVVLKEFLLPIYVDVNVRKDVLESFQSEARILKHLDHPQVVKLAEYFVEDHRAYLVLEHIDGLSLRDIVLQEGPLSETRVRQLAEQMCAILTYLHSQDPPVVHRDFTPENLILRNDGLLKLIDFNVAKQVESTATGSVVGKPSYLPPEQFRGQPVSQSDIYGMGATLHFLLTGEDPEPISVSHPQEKVLTLTSSLDKIVARATAADLRDRYETASQLLQDLKDSSDLSSADRSAPLLKTTQLFGDEEQEQSLDRVQEPMQNPNMAQAPFETIFQFKAAPGQAGKFRLVEGIDNTGQAGLELANDSSAVYNTNGLMPAPGGLEPCKDVPKKSIWHFFRLLAAPSKKIGFILSCFTVALASTWPIFPNSVGWLDPDRQFHDQLKKVNIGILLSSNEVGGPSRAKLLAECNKCVAIKPSCVDGYLARAEYYSLDDQTDNQIADLRRAAKIEPHNHAILSRLTATLIGRGYYSEGVIIGQATLAAPDKLGTIGNIALPDLFGIGGTIDSATKMDLALAHLNLGQDKESLTELEQAEELYRRFAERFFLLRMPAFDSLPCRSDYPLTLQAMAFEEAHDPARAFESFEGQKRSKFEEGYSAVSPLQFHIDSLKRVKSELMQDSADQRAIGTSWAFCEGLAYNGLGDFKKSIARFTEAIALRPDYADSYIWRGEANRLLGRLAQATIDIDKGLALEPNSIHAHYAKALLLHKMGQYLQSNGEFEEVDKVAHEALTAVERGRNYMAMGEFGQALNLFDQGVKRRSDSHCAVFLRGVAALKLQRFAEAFRDIMMGYSTNPEDKNDYYAGVAYQALGDDRRAVKRFSRAKEEESRAGRRKVNGSPASEGRDRMWKEWH